MKEMKKFINDGISYVCSRYKSRSPGSNSEYECQKYFEGQLHQWCDTVEMDEFKLHPKAFLGWIILCASLELIAIVFLWLGAVFNRASYLCVALLLTAFSALLVWFEFFRYRKFIDNLFPTRTSHNVFAVRKSKEPAKRRIIFGGHADAAYEFTFIRKANGKFGIPLIITAVAGVVILFVVSIISLVISRTKSRLARRIHYATAIIATFFAPIFVLFFFFTNWKCVTDGANDNLSACYAAFAVMKHMADNNIRFKDTDVCCLITGSEEAGLRGADAFAKKHHKELTDIETVFIAMDTLRETEQLQVYTSGMYGTQKSSDAVGALVSKAAADCGVELKVAEPYPGALDADAFARKGLLACGLCAVDHNPKPYYHTRMDNADNIDPECILLCAQICMRAAEIYDQSGM